MRKIAILAVLVLVLTACMSQTGVSTPQIQQNPAQSEPTSEEQNDVDTPAVVSQQSGSPRIVEYTAGGFWLHLFSPQDGEVVNQPEINFSGEVSSETVITLNDDISLIQGGGKFSLPVELVEGPNVIEVVASNLDGDEITFVLTIVYEK